ncbi:MAG TPA: transporter [Terriglobales bacterium]|nr:transporter [Terriglobales bacterium]
MPRLLLLFLLFSATALPLTAAGSDNADANPAPTPALAQPISPNSDENSPIQDNSFLVEEAYNQEDGVIQHIFTFQRWASSGDWLFTQTDEWPLRNLKHQLSLTVAAAHAGSIPGSDAGWGDTAVNYRYQLLGNGEVQLAIAPRLSVLLPTGNSTLGRGSGGIGLQTNIPVSIVLNKRLVTHWNAGATWVSRSRNPLGQSAPAVSVNLGQSFVWLAAKRFNALLETVWTSTENVIGTSKTIRSPTAYVSPGIRWAYNCRNGLQVVPGVGLPIGVGPSAGEKGLIVYLSFEHPFAWARSR